MRLLLLVLLVACADSEEDPDEPPPMMGTPSIEGTPVETFESTSCSTGDVLALSRQIAEVWQHGGGAAR